jgi:Asp/Glu/hydantoin racemase
MTAFSSVSAYGEILRRHAASVVDPATEVRFRGIDAATYGALVPGDVFPYPYLKHLVQDEALEACFQSEREGCDAFVIGSFSEPHPRQCRSAVDIPVLSLPESAFLTACALAERFALITLSPHYARRLSEVVRRHGMEQRVAGLFPLDEGLTERDVNDALQNPDRLLGAFRHAARLAVDAGADLVIPAEGILNEVAYLHGLREAHGAVVMDAVGVVLLDAEKHVHMKRKLGLGVGRAWSYPRASPELTETLRRNVGRKP